MHKTVRLNTGAVWPAIGFGTWKLQEGDQAYDAVTEALAAGYRVIDTAAIYMNEASVGRAIADSSLPREEIFVTTKLWSTDHGRERTKAAYLNSLKRLGLDYIDLYLIHWPATDDVLESWQALEEMYREEKVKNIGVSNFTVEDLKTLADHSRLVPAVNQIEFHPEVFKEQQPILEYCQERDIVVQAYSPLGKGEVLDHRALRKIGQQHNKTPAQVCLRWCLQHGTMPIPKSSSLERMKENLDIFDFELTDREMADINKVSQGARLMGPPVTVR